MKKVKLGNSDLEVTNVCLGTMTWGSQNTEMEAHQQLDYAIKERGVNFVDTAELYPVPPVPETQGRTERYLGTWLNKNPEWRSKILIATKVMGYSSKTHVPLGRKQENDFAAANDKDGTKVTSRVNKEQIFQAINASLKRLQTDYVDLYQVHWPDRYCPMFGSSAYRLSRRRDDEMGFEELVSAMGDLTQQKKIRYWGLSNETSFGVISICLECDKQGVPRPISIQNSFSMIHRAFQGDLAEACAPWNYNLSLLPWSPLAGGALSGKYLGGARPENSRYVLFPAFQPRFFEKTSMDAIERYNKIAQEAGISLAKMALAWCAQQDFMHNGSTIIGATTMEQLKENLDAFEITLSEETMEKIDEEWNVSKDTCYKV